MCPNSSVGSTLDIFPLILVDQRGREFKSTLRNNFFWPFFSASNYIIFYIYVICMLYSTRIRSQKVWVVYVYYRFILEQCVYCLWGYQNFTIHQFNYAFPLPFQRKRDAFEKVLMLHKPSFDIQITKFLIILNNSVQYDVS